jgi:hypothetical protein
MSTVTPNSRARRSASSASPAGRLSTISFKRCRPARRARRRRRRRVVQVAVLTPAPGVVLRGSRLGTSAPRRPPVSTRTTRGHDRQSCRPASTSGDAPDRGRR